MKTNELMIKDWVRCDDVPCRIWMVDWQYNLVRCHHNGTAWTCGTEEITPIKLTTNILLDSEFESVSDSLVSMKCSTPNDKEDIYICIDFYDNDRKYDTDRARWRVWSRGYSTHDLYAAVPSGNILADVVKNGTICGVRL